VLHAAALPGYPYDGRTLRAAIEDTQRLTGREIERKRRPRTLVEGLAVAR